jgi:ferrochelatase
MTQPPTTSTGRGRNSGREKVGVVLFQLGGPDSTGSVEPFLYNLFCDPDIIDIPLGFLLRKPLARLISSRRSPHVKEIYRKIGGRSPIRKLTDRQAARLEASLRRHMDAVVTVAMRYWEPSTERAVEHLLREDVHRVVLLPLYPQYSRSTSGSSLNAWARAVRGTRLAHLPVHTVREYCERPAFVRAVVQNIRVALNRVRTPDRVHLLFSAHGTPLSLVRQGDPYQAQVVRTYEAVVRTGSFGLPHSLCYQSKVGPARWLEPSLTGALEALAGNGTTHVIVVPIAFVSDHSETLYEINMEAREHARSLGIRYFDMSPALNAHPLFMQALAECVIEAVPA